MISRDERTIFCRRRVGRLAGERGTLTAEGTPSGIRRGRSWKAKELRESLESDRGLPMQASRRCPDSRGGLGEVTKRALNRGATRSTYAIRRDRQGLAGFPGCDPKFLEPQV